MPDTHDPDHRRIRGAPEFQPAPEPGVSPGEAGNIEKSGVPVAALVSAEDLVRLRRYEAGRREEFAVVDRIRRAFTGVPPEEMEREVARSVEAVRAEKRNREETLSSST